MLEKGRGPVAGIEKSAHIPSRNEREVMEFKKLNREKSFDEARTAVQSQIEKIFQKVRRLSISIFWPQVMHTLTTIPITMGAMSTFVNSKTHFDCSSGERWWRRERV